MKNDYILLFQQFFKDSNSNIIQLQLNVLHNQCIYSYFSYT